MQATSKDSDQTARMRRLTWGFAGRTLHTTKLEISCRGSITVYAGCKDIQNLRQSRITYYMQQKCD